MNADNAETLELDKNRKRKEIHPTARLNYIPRIIGCLFCASILASIFYNSMNALLLCGIIFHGLLWPHIAYFRVLKATDSKRAEVVNLLTDCFIIGIWTTVVNFRLWPVAAFNIAMLMDNVATGGLRLLIKGILSTASGIILAGILFGFKYTTEQTLLTGAISAFTITFYVVVVAFASYQLTLRYKNQKQKLKVRTRELQQARDALWGEMHLAKKIQTLLLPKQPAILGYDISAYMAPADEVGGDYYDIINVDGYDWIVIGDVSGHGVPAGLIMMMAMTSIHSVLVVNPKLRPSDLLAKVNRVITENIKRLGEDKYITTTVIACMKDGKMHFSGLHQDIMIYSPKTRNVRLIETNGMWLGIVDTIDTMLYDGSFEMEENDVMLIYTDGVLEAIPRQDAKTVQASKKEMFGEKKLIELFTRLGDKRPHDIKDGIIAELNDYACNDDVAILVMKRLAGQKT